MNNSSSVLPNREVTCAILPTEYMSAEIQIIKLIDSVGPDILICLGVDSSSTELRLERVALNIDNAPIADNAGDIRHSCMIIPNGPPAYFSTIPFKEIWKELINSGIPARISHYAGTYVCNHVYYTSLHYITTNKLDVVCGFIHIPLLSDVDSGVIGKGLLDCEDILRALKCIISLLAATF
jgi:pyroglutamyl-peptidase